MGCETCRHERGPRVEGPKARPRRERYPSAIPARAIPYCPFRMADQRGLWVCLANLDAPGPCGPSGCRSRGRIG
jgi:hypothetical protein